MKTVLPKCLTDCIDSLMVNRFWWDGVQVNIPMHSVYAIIPDPVASYYTEISGKRVPVMELGKYRIPVWDPMHKDITTMPKYAMIIIHQETEKFGLYAYPADCLDESFSLSYDEWFERQKIA